MSFSENRFLRHSGKVESEKNCEKHEDDGNPPALKHWTKNWVDVMPG